MFHSHAPTSPPNHKAQLNTSTRCITLQQALMFPCTLAVPRSDLISLVLSTASVENTLVEGALVLVLLRAGIERDLHHSKSAPVLSISLQRPDVVKEQCSRQKDRTGEEWHPKSRETIHIHTTTMV